MPLGLQANKQASLLFLIVGIIVISFLLYRQGKGRKPLVSSCSNCEDEFGPLDSGSDGVKAFLPVRRQKQYATTMSSQQPIDPQLQYMAPLPKQGYSGVGMTVLEHLQDKTHHNRYASDFMFRDPFQKFMPADYYTHPQSTAWPLAGSCRPLTEPPLRGLNAAEVIQGENSMRLYATYTVCPGELNDRYMSVQL